MANEPIQLPNISLPGAEYFSLAPNRTIALNGRRRVVLSAGPILVGGSSDGGATLTALIESPFPVTAGIYLHEMYFEYSPADTSGQIQIKTLRMGFGTNSANIGTAVADAQYSMGIPYATLFSPQFVMNVMSERDKLVTARDVQALGGQAFTNVLTAAFQISVHNNDSTSNHNFSVNLKMIYDRLDGFLE